MAVARPDLKAKAGVKVGGPVQIPDSDHDMKIEVDGDTAFVSETYTYHITFKDGARAPIERRGAATSVLRKRGDEWRFDVYHSSARPFRPAA